MDEVIREATVGLIVGAIGGGAVVVVVALVTPRRPCADCGELLPRFRKPANLKQMLRGGWTCPRCGCEVDRRGQKVSRA